MSARLPVVLSAGLAFLLIGCSAESPVEPAAGPTQLAKGGAAALPRLDFRKGFLLEGGEVLVTLRIRCPEGFDLLEEPFDLRQGSVTGVGFPGGTCTGHWERRTARVFLDDPEGPGFQEGTALARGQLLMENPTTGELLVAQAEEVIRIR